MQPLNTAAITKAMLSHLMSLLLNGNPNNEVSPVCEHLKQTVVAVVY